MSVAFREPNEMSRPSLAHRVRVRLFGQPRSIFSGQQLTRMPCCASMTSRKPLIGPSEIACTIMLVGAAYKVISTSTDAMSRKRSDRDDPVSTNCCSFRRCRLPPPAETSLRSSDSYDVLTKYKIRAEKVGSPKYLAVRRWVLVRRLCK